MTIKPERWFDYESAVAIAKNSMLNYFREVVFCKLYLNNPGPAFLYFSAYL